MDDRNRLGRTLRGPVAILLAKAGSSTPQPFPSDVCLTGSFRLEHWTFYSPAVHPNTSPCLEIFLFSSTHVSLLVLLLESTKKERLISSFAAVSLLAHLLSKLNNPILSPFLFLTGHVSYICCHPIPSSLGFENPCEILRVSNAAELAKLTLSWAAGPHWGWQGMCSRP